VIAEATAVRGRALGADLWIKCSEDIRSTEVEILFRLADLSPFAGQRFEATAEAAPRFPFTSDFDADAVIATAIAVDEGNRDVPVSELLSAAVAATAEAAHTSATVEAARMARVRGLVATVQAAGGPRNADSRAAATALQPIYRAAVAVEESIDEIFISRRAAGDPGRWMKSGWKHSSTVLGQVILQEAPAAAFIQQLSEVEEFAVLITHDAGEDTAAVFDVRYLDAALAAFDVGWDC